MPYSLPLRIRSRNGDVAYSRGQKTVSYFYQHIPCETLETGTPKRTGVNSFFSWPTNLITYSNLGRRKNQQYQSCWLPSKPVTEASMYYPPRTHFNMAHRGLLSSSLFFSIVCNALTDTRTTARALSSYPLHRTSLYTHTRIPRTNSFKHIAHYNA